MVTQNFRASNGSGASSAHELYQRYGCCFSLTDRVLGGLVELVPPGWIGQCGKNRGFWDQQVRAGIAPAAARTGTCVPTLTR